MVGLDDAVVGAVSGELSGLDGGVDVLLGDLDGLGAFQGVVGDGGHLEHVLGGGVDEWVVGVEVTVDDGEVPVVLQQGHDGDCAFDLAAVDQFSVLVVAELDVLGFAE